MKINTVKPVHPKLKDIENEFRHCLKTGLVTNNSKFVRLFEEKLHNFFNSRLKPILLCNGEMALFSLIQAWKYNLGYEISDSFRVIVPSFTFPGTVNAIVQNNLEPVFCDVDDTMTIDVSKLNEEKLPENTKMIISVGAYGNLPDVRELIEFARKNSLVLLMDNAPAFGATCENKYANNYGVDEIFSLHATKILSSMEGGVVITNNETIHEYIINFRDFGQIDKEKGDVVMPGLNAKMQEVSALVGLANLSKFDSIFQSRKNVVNKYISVFIEPINKGLFNVMRVESKIVCNYWYFPIVLKEDASNFYNYMKSNEIMVRRYYTATHSLTFYRNKFIEFNLDHTIYIKNKVVCLPLYSYMDEKEINYITKTVLKHFN